MKEDIIKFFLEKGFLLDKDILNFLSEIGSEELSREIMNKIAIGSRKKIITKGLINENIERIKPLFSSFDGEKKKLVEKFFVNISILVEVKKETEFKKETEAKREPNEIRIINSPFVLPQKIEVKDFIRHFRNRYNFLRSIIQQRPGLENLTSIDKINSNNRNFSVIGIVSSKQTTKNKNIILEIEDLTGKIKLLVNQSKKEIFEKAKEILLDDTVGFKCSGTKDFLFVNGIFYPDCFLSEKNRSENEVYAVFISDIHIGSRNFLEKNFEKFVEWLNEKAGNEKYKEIVKRIKYIFITGDAIEGVGVYPGQEKFLKIEDIKEQYRILAEYLKKIPENINIILCPGQHDGVRVAEPQPPVGRDFGEDLHKIKNLSLVSNPSLIEIENRGNKKGIKILMYHGASLSFIINEIDELRLKKAHKNPVSAVKHLLLRRHLSPVHGNSVYIPNSNEDPLLIREVPDIIATGDLHRPDIDIYNGVLMIASSCWQSITPFEEKVGNIPDPCKAVILNLKTFEIKIMDFSDSEEEVKFSKECKEENKNRKVEAADNNENIKEMGIVCEVKNG